MALQDLTPQLRTRLSRTERAAGWFVMLAVALLVFGLAYYIYATARSKGWFLTKIQYQTGVNDAAGLKVGDPVKLMGFNAGEITQIVPNDPYDYYGVTVYFRIKDPNYGYIWSDSLVKVSADFLGNRYLEVTKGKIGMPTVIQTTNDQIIGVLKYHSAHPRYLDLLKQRISPETAWSELKEEAKTNQQAFYQPHAKTALCWIDPDESPTLSERLEKVADQVEQSLPNILALTNQIAAVLSHGANTISNLDVALTEARPMLTNFAALSAELRGPGALGEWALGTNLMQQVGDTLGSANTAITHVDTNLTATLEALTESLDQLSGITSNLHAQVDANTNILSSISKAVVDADDFVQGLKRHWLFRSAFKKKKKDP